MGGKQGDRAFLPPSSAGVRQEPGEEIRLLGEGGVCGRHSGETIYQEKTLWGSEWPPEGGSGLLEKRQTKRGMGNFQAS